MITHRQDTKLPLKVFKKIKAMVKQYSIDGGRVLMALGNTLMMVQTGFPTGVCVVCSCVSNH